MKQGALIFNENTDRYDIRFDLADYYGGLHCGECLEVFTGGKWKPTRIEYGDNWYLEPISLVDLANAIKADKERGKEEKPSIRAQLKAAKEQTAPKKAARSKSQDLERS